jgi:hypothetical protein
LWHLKEKDVTQFTVNGERRERDKNVKGFTKRKQGVMDKIRNKLFPSIFNGLLHWYISLQGKRISDDVFYLAAGVAVSLYICIL